MYKAIIEFDKKEVFEELKEIFKEKEKGVTIVKNNDTEITIHVDETFANE